MLLWETTEAEQYLDYWSVSVKEIEVLQRVNPESRMVYQRNL